MATQKSKAKETEKTTRPNFGAFWLSAQYPKPSVLLLLLLQVLLLPLVDGPEVDARAAAGAARLRLAGALPAK